MFVMERTSALVCDIFDMAKDGKAELCLFAAPCFLLFVCFCFCFLGGISVNLLGAKNQNSLWRTWIGQNWRTGVEMEIRKR